MIEFGGREIPVELSEIVEPARSVLLVWDMQNDQAGGAFNKQNLIRNSPPVIAAAEAIALLAEAVNQSDEEIWQEALDGRVAFARLRFAP
jgi:hypothetical protein